MAERNQAQAQEGAGGDTPRHRGFSAADEITKLDRLKSQKSISEEEYTRLRARLIP